MILEISFIFMKMYEIRCSLKWGYFGPKVAIFITVFCWDILVSRVSPYIYTVKPEIFRTFLFSRLSRIRKIREIKKSEKFCRAIMGVNITTIMTYMAIL